MSALAAASWRIAPSVRWRQWDGEVAAYDDATGSTHHLADLAAWVFAQLAREAQDVAALGDAASGAVVLADGRDLPAAVAETIALLHVRRLIETVRR